MDKFKLYNDDCLNVLKTMEDNSIDSCVTDPPYGLSFMGKAWDYDVPKKEIWEEVFRVLKPGGHLLAFFGSRTYHRGVIPIEDAGFEIRDQIMWLYGSGFPKSHNIGKAIDAAAGATRKVIGTKVSKSGGMAHIMKTNTEQGYRPNDYYEDVGNVIEITEPATEEAKQWEGWGTALKPAHEPIVVARKPITQTVAKNVLEYGTGALNIDACRTEEKGMKWEKPRGGIWKTDSNVKAQLVENELGRWPANIIHDSSDEVVSLLTETNSKFFYSAKASKSDKDEGLENFLAKKNFHPTVKPTDLMKYLCRLVTPKNGVVLDPFMGSGSTGKAAAQEGFRFIGVEMSKEYFEIAEARVEHAYQNKNLNLEEFFS